jgi:hypothetical protein
LRCFDNFLNTLGRWWQDIINYFINRDSSGFVEGLNNKLKLTITVSRIFCKVGNKRTTISQKFNHFEPQVNCEPHQSGLCCIRKSAFIAATRMGGDCYPYPGMRACQRQRLPLHYPGVQPHRSGAIQA